MKRKAHGAQKLRHINRIVEAASTAQRSDSPAQAINQRFLRQITIKNRGVSAAISSYKFQIFSTVYSFTSMYVKENTPTLKTFILRVMPKTARFIRPSQKTSKLFWQTSNNAIVPFRFSWNAKCGRF